MKKQIALALIAASCMAATSFAADLPASGPYRPSPFMVRQPIEWTGLYFGANAGYGWGQYSSNITFTGLGASGLTNPVPGFGPAGIAGGIIAVGGPTELSGTRIIGSGSPSGAIAGGQIGFNWQAGMFVFGAEIDGQWSGQENTFTVACGPRCSATESIKIRSLATGRGRFGLAFDWIMPYVTGGAALVNGLNNLSMTVAGTSASFLPLSHSTLGWTAGAGVEIALWSNWSAKFEYLYVSANGATKVAFIPNALGLGFASTPGDYRDNIVRVGFNYRPAARTKSIVEAHTHDIVAIVTRRRCETQAQRIRDERNLGCAVSADIEILELRRPVAPQRNLDAGASGPASVLCDSGRKLALVPQPSCLDC